MATDKTDNAKPNRMTMTEMVRALLTKQTAERSSVTLSRNAKGETQIEVVVRTSETTDGAVPDIEAAEAAAIKVYENLRNRYPLASGLTTPAPEPGK